MRGAMPDHTGVPDKLAANIFGELRERGLENEPLGIDMTDMVALASLHRAGLATTDGSPVMLAARTIKTDEEVALLDHAAAIVDATYERIYEILRPGVRESEIVAEAQRLLFELGSEQVEAINAVSGDRCIPHPHVFSDRLLRPGDQAFFDIIHSFMGYRTCYYRTFCGRRRQPVPDRRLQAVPRVARRLRSTWSAPASPPTRSPRSGRPPRSRASPTRKRASACSSATASASASTSRR